MCTCFGLILRTLCKCSYLGVGRWLLKDEQGLLSKEAVRTCIDGSVFYRLADENESRKVRSKGCTGSHEHVSTEYCLTTCGRRCAPPGRRE